ncbi:MAG: ATP-binding protein [bacterium]
MIKDRYLHQNIASDLADKMVFLAGPRQVGKTTLAQLIGQKEFKQYSYLNWDSREDRSNILNGKYRADAGLVIFDEIHKYSQWKNFVKGEYDKYKEHFKILVTGSARLNLYRRGGDSLMGRYHYYRLHPFSMAEAVDVSNNPKPFGKLDFQQYSQIKRPSALAVFSALLDYGGFPEPFLKKDPRSLRRFHNQRLERLVKEDIRDLEPVGDISALQVLVEILPSKVGSLLSLNALREDFQVSHKTMTLWMNILERFYYHFRIYPFAAKTINSLRKEPKMYLWDWSQISDRGARLENMAASHLLKLVHYLHDAEGYQAELYFLRDTAQREVDFLVTVGKKPWFAVEVKESQQEVSGHLKYFMAKLGIPFAYQVVGEAGVDFLKDKVRVISADKFLTGLV